VKTDILFYYLLQSFPQIFFELIGQPINRATDWQAIVIYRRRSTETPALPRYRELMAHRVQCIYLDELGQTDNQLLGIGIVQLVVESKNKAAEKARQLIIRAEQELPDAQNQQQILELIETIIVGKFPKFQSLSCISF